MDHLEELKQRANTFYKDGNIDEAIQLFSAAINRDPDCEDTRTVATLYYNRSAAWRRKGEFEKALDDANMSLALHPKWTKALYRRGILLLECGRYAEALTELKVVQRADPTFDDDLQDWLRRAHNWLAKPKHTQNFYKFPSMSLFAKDVLECRVVVDVVWFYFFVRQPSVVIQLGSLRCFVCTSKGS